MKKEQYVNEVTRLLYTNRKTKKRLKEDLEQRIDDALEMDPYFNLETEMGKPHELAQELMMGLGEDMKPPRFGPGAVPYEYKSKATLFGYPLVHINTGGTYGSTVAKGIIAIGDIAIGGVAIGGVSVGVISIGGVGIGLASLAGVAIGGLALGGVALGGFAIGGVAYGLFQMFGAITG